MCAVGRRIGMQCPITSSSVVCTFLPWLTTKRRIVCLHTAHRMWLSDVDGLRLGTKGDLAWPIHIEERSRQARHSKANSPGILAVALTPTLLRQYKSEGERMLTIRTLFTHGRGEVRRASQSDCGIEYLKSWSVLPRTSIRSSTRGRSPCTVRRLLDPMPCANHIPG
jgi:hypothetical protein